MTEQEAIKDISENIKPYAGGKSLDMAIKALEEIQQYRAIGTVKEIKIREAQAKRLSEGYLTNLGILREYQSIGTPEECGAAAEKQKAKKPKEYEDKFYGCPTCGNVLLHKWEKYPTKLIDKKNGLPYCSGCGQKLDWSDEDYEQTKS